MTINFFLSFCFGKIFSYVPEDFTRGVYEIKMALLSPHFINRATQFAHFSTEEEGEGEEIMTTNDSNE